MPDYTGTNNLNQINVADPGDGDPVGEYAAALRETRLVLKTVLLVAHNPDGTLRAITASEIADKTLTSEKYADSSILAIALGDDVLEERHFKDSQIPGAAIKDNTLTANLFANEFFSNNMVADGIISAVKLAGLIGGDKLLSSGTDDANRAITGDHIKDDTIPSRALTSVDPAKLSGGNDSQILVRSGNRWVPTTLSGALSIDSDGVATLSSTNQVVTIGDNKTRGADGGASVAGSWLVRDLAKFTDEANLVTFTGNAFTAKPGTYQVYIEVPGYQVGRHQARLKSSQPSSVQEILLWGSAAVAPTGVVTTSIISGIIEIEEESWSQQVEHWCQNTQSAGLGLAAESNNTVSFGNHEEVYTNGFLRKLD